MITAPTATEAEAVATVTIERLEQAWNEGDGATFGVEFTDDADFVDIRGDHHRGRVAIADGHQVIFDTIYLGSTVRYEVETTRLVGTGCIVAVVAATLDAPSGPLAGRNRSRFTTLFVESDGRWAITAFHNTLRRSPS